MGGEIDREQVRRLREATLERIIRASDRTAKRRSDPAVLVSKLDALITELEGIDPVLADELRQEWWELELLHVGWAARVPFVFHKLLERRLGRLNAIARAG